MRIAFFLNSFPILSQTFVINQITGLMDLGHDVDIYVRHIRENSVCNSAVEKYALMSRTFRHHHSRMIMPDEKLKRVFEAVGLLCKPDNDRSALVRSVNFLRYGKEAASLGLFYQARTFLEKKNQYDIFHCHFGTNGNLAVKLRDIGAINGKVITTFHGYDVSKYLEKKGPRIYDNLFEKGDVFLPISHEMKKRLIDLGCNPEKIIVHRMGIDPAEFTPLPSKGLGEIHVLTVGRLVEKKGIIYAIQALSRLMKRFPQIRYTIVGDGPQREALESAIENLGLGGKVELLGWRGREDVRDLMRKAHIFLAPSVTDRNGDKEGLPVVLMEALACGLPVVSTLHSAIPELVEDGKSGFLVPERDVDALTERLAAILDHPERLTEMGRAGRSKVEKEFNIHKLNDALVKVFSNAIKDGRDGFRSSMESLGAVSGEKKREEVII